MSMLSNYFKTAIRHILHHRGYAIINITGLAVGLAVFILTASFVDFHLSFDEFHKDADQIFSVVQVLPSDIKGEHHTAKIPAPLLDAFRGEI
ncbi:MAG: ABC transporter permease, partial [Desulfobacterales bacterium]